MPPKPGEFKKNFDGAMFNENDEPGIGIVARNSLGQVIAAMAEIIQKPHSVEVLEMIAARRAVSFIHEIVYISPILKAIQRLVSRPYAKVTCCYHPLVT